MRIGILGGTFDPVHNGHIALAQAAISGLELDTLLLIPSGEPPHKKPLAGRKNRLKMARRAAKDIDGVEVSDIEIRRSGSTYAVDTLKELRKEYPEAELIYILGSDAAAKVRNWKCADKVMKLCTFACVVRKGAVQEIPEGMIRLEADIPDISSADIRADIAEGRSVADRIAPRVYRYIRKHGLYIAGMPVDDIVEDLEKRLKPSRFQHTLGVAETCRQLAKIHGVDVGRAYIAGLLHDCAKNLSDDKLLSLADASGADCAEREIISTLHAPVGAYVAQERYGVHDEDVLHAIRVHTIGAEQMSALDAVLYVADMIEPNRKYFPGIDDIRRLAAEDIFGAAALGGRLTGEYVAARAFPQHPTTEKMIKSIETGGMKHG